MPTWHKQGTGVTKGAGGGAGWRNRRGWGIRGTERTFGVMKGVGAWGGWRSRWGCGKRGAERGLGDVEGARKGCTRPHLGIPPSLLWWALAVGGSPSSCPSSCPPHSLRVLLALSSPLGSR